MAARYPHRRVPARRIVSRYCAPDTSTCNRKRGPTCNLMVVNPRHAGSLRRDVPTIVPEECPTLSPREHRILRAEPGNSKDVEVIGFAAFRVTTVDTNSHNAPLLDDDIVSGPGTNDGCRDRGGTVVVRLTA